MNSSQNSKNPRLEEKNPCEQESVGGQRQNLAAPGVVVGVAERGEEDLDANLAGLRRRHLHVLDHERLVRLVRHRRCTHAPIISPPAPDQMKRSTKNHQHCRTTTAGAINLEQTRKIKHFTFAGDDLTLGGGSHCSLRDLGCRCDGWSSREGGAQEDVAVL